MLGDAFVYGLSLWVINKTDIWKAKVALVKGVVMTVLVLILVVEIVGKLLKTVEVDGGVVFGVGLLALTVNIFCFWLLTLHKKGGINFRSAWVCSRNDLIINTGLILGAVAIMLTGSKWPDVIVGLGIGAYVLNSSLKVIKDAKKEIKAHESGSKNRSY